MQKCSENSIDQERSDSIEEIATTESHFVLDRPVP